MVFVQTTYAHTAVTTQEAISSRGSTKSQAIAISPLPHKNADAVMTP